MGAPAGKFNCGLRGDFVRGHQRLLPLPVSNHMVFSHKCSSVQTLNMRKSVYLSKSLRQHLIESSVTYFVLFVREIRTLLGALESSTRGFAVESTDAPCTAIVVRVLQAETITAFQRSTCSWKEKSWLFVTVKVTCTRSAA
jgi:hypothetical protein